MRVTIELGKEDQGQNKI